MNNALQVFNFEKRDIRVVMKDGEPWWVAKDVCDVLEIQNARDAVSALDDDERNTVGISDGNRGNPNMNVINESGLYTLIMRSNKPEAKRFRKWVTSEVLPTIRKHGAYMTPAKLEEVLLHPDTLIKLAQNLKDEQEKRAALEAQAEANRPKVLFADSVTASKTSILVGDLAKLLRQNGVQIGQNRLFQWLRENGYLIKRKGDSFNMPTQTAMESGLFEVLERTHSNPDGSIRITRTTKVTGKGQLYFINVFLKEAA